MSVPIPLTGITIVTPAHCHEEPGEGVVRVSDIGKQQIKAYRQEVKCDNLKYAHPYLYTNHADNRAKFTVEEFGKKGNRIEVEAPDVISVKDHGKYPITLFATRLAGVSASDISSHGSQYMAAILAGVPSEFSHPMVFGEPFDILCLMRYFFGRKDSDLHFLRSSFQMLSFGDFSGFSLIFDEKGNPLIFQLVGKHRFAPLDLEPT